MVNQRFAGVVGAGAQRSPPNRISANVPLRLPPNSQSENHFHAQQNSPAHSGSCDHSESPIHTHDHRPSTEERAHQSPTGEQHIRRHLAQTWAPPLSIARSPRRMVTPSISENSQSTVCSSQGKGLNICPSSRSLCASHQDPASIRSLAAVVRASLRIMRG